MNGLFLQNFELFQDIKFLLFQMKIFKRFRSDNSVGYSISARYLSSVGHRHFGNRKDSLNPIKTKDIGSFRHRFHLIWFTLEIIWGLSLPSRAPMKVLLEDLPEYELMITCQIRLEFLSGQIESWNSCNLHEDSWIAWFW